MSIQGERQIDLCDTAGHYVERMLGRTLFDVIGVHCKRHDVILWLLVSQSKRFQKVHYRYVQQSFRVNSPTGHSRTTAVQSSSRRSQYWDIAEDTSIDLIHTVFQWSRGRYAAGAAC